MISISSGFCGPLQEGTKYLKGNRCLIAAHGHSLVYKPKPLELKAEEMKISGVHLEQVERYIAFGHNSPRTVDLNKAHCKVIIFILQNKVQGKWHHKARTLLGMTDEG